MPDDGTLVSRSGTRVCFWEIKTGKLLRAFEPKPGGDKQFVNFPVLSADGQTFAGRVRVDTLGDYTQGVDIEA